MSIACSTTHSYYIEIYFLSFFNYCAVISQKKHLLIEYVVSDTYNNANTDNWSDANCENVLLDFYISTLGMPLDQLAFKDLSSYTIYSWLGKVNTYHNSCYFYIYKVIKINPYQIKSEPKHNHQQC